MGAGYQAIPRFKHTTLVGPRWALASLILMLVGVIVRSVAEPLAAGAPALVYLAVGAALLELAAITIFATLIAATLWTAKKGLAVYDGYILVATFCFIIQAAYEAVYLWATLNAGGADQLISLVATWQGALRDIQIHGFAVLMILGVSQRILAPFFGFREPRKRLSAVALVVLSVAIVGEVLGLILMRKAGRAWAGLWYVSAVTFAVTVVMLVWDWGLFRPARYWDRNLKFMRAAYAWLLISLAMLVMLPAYQFGLRFLAPESDAAQRGFSHAYYGAIRHAITVGFVSLMIVGVAGKMVPTLNGIDINGLSRLWLPFVLLNTGCAMRVIFQTATDLAPWAFPIAGVSGILEVAGLAIWGAHVWGIMDGWVRARNGPSGATSCATPFQVGQPVEAGNRVGDLLDHHPELLPKLIELGFRPLANPVLRSTVARRVTIEQACRQLDLPVADVLKNLNREMGTHLGERRPLPMA
jgi:hypothetical protein